MQAPIVTSASHAAGLPVRREIISIRGTITEIENIWRDRWAPERKCCPDIPQERGGQGGSFAEYSRAPVMVRSVVTIGETSDVAAVDLREQAERMHELEQHGAVRPPRTATATSHALRCGGLVESGRAGATPALTRSVTVYKPFVVGLPYYLPD